jgi:hypothetical protein
MTRVYYGGPPDGGVAGQEGGLELQVVDTKLCALRPIMDGPTRLYDELTYECVAVLNPRATSFQVAVGERTPLPLVDQTAAKTSDAIRHFLLAPRRKFLMTVGADTLFESPFPTRECDAAGGPIPYRCDILDIVSLKTILIRWGVKTWINPCERVTEGNAAVILSHRWTQERDVEVDGLSTLIIQGHMIFDIGKLNALDHIPDDYWQLSSPIVRRGFRRAHIQVTATEDGRELRYCVVDREVPLSRVRDGSSANFPHVSRIEATHYSTITKPDTTKNLKEVLFKKDRKDNRDWMDRAGQFVMGSIPEMEHIINVKLWGYRYATKMRLREHGKRLISTLVAANVPNFVKALSGYTATIGQDVAGKFVDLRLTLHVPPIWAGLTNAEKLQGFAEDLWPPMPEKDGVAGVFRDTVELNPPDPVTNEPMFMMPQRRGVGSWLGNLIAQRLTRACQNQPATFDVDPALGDPVPQEDIGGV